MRNRELVIAFPIFDGITEKFVLLGERQKDPWKNLFSGFGGNVEKKDKSPLARQVLELRQEAGIIAREQVLEKKAEFVIAIEEKEPKLLHVYIVNNFSGEVKCTEEMRPEWFSFHALPYHRMIKGDEFWVPRVLAGESLSGIIFRDADLNFLDIVVKSCVAY
jgi:8-oxo-dGTP pyrophosphatase MutT (NUDIX family)